MENTLKDLGQKVEGIENKIPTKNYFSKDYNINLELPISMSSIDRKVKYYDINQAMTDKDRANWFGKVIPIDEQDRILKNYKPSPKEESGVKTFFTEGGKSFWNTTQDILTYPYQWGIQKSAGLGVNVAEKVAKINDFLVNENDKEKSVLEVEKELNPNYEDTKFNLKEAKIWSPAWWGQGSGNVTASLVLPIFTGKVPYTALSFGMMTDTDVTRARLEQGDSLLKANVKGSSSGAAITAFELFHIDTLTKRVILPRVQRYLARFFTGATVETTQQGIEDVAMGDADTRTPEQKREAYISSIVFGGAGDVLGHIARDTATRKIQKEIKKKALKEGYSETLATELAQTSMVDENPDYEKISQELKKEVNQRQDFRRGEVYEEFIKQGDTPEIASKKANELVPSVEEVESEILEDLEKGTLLTEEERANLEKSFRESEEIEREMPFEYIYVKADIEKQLTEAGVSEEEVGKIPSVFASQIVNSFKVAQEQGLDDTFEAYYKHIMAVGDIKVEPKERERVAELQEGIDRYMEESQGGVLYSKENGFDPDTYFEQPEVIENIQKSKENFSEALDDLAWGQYSSKKKPIVLFKPTRIWTMVGLPDRKISFDISKIRKVIKEHRLTIDDLKSLPEKLANPEFIFESATDDVAYVGVLDRNNEPFVAIVMPVGNDLKVTNIIKSAYNKDSGFVNREINAGHLLYDKKNPMEFRRHRASFAQVFPPSDIDGNINQENENVNSKLYSQTEGDILGSYDYKNKTIELFKGRNPTTLIHELAHNFFLNHLKTMESLGATKLNKPVYDFLSKVGGRNIESLNDFEKSDWENLVESYIDYINKDEAPNLLTKSLFERAKSWMISTFRIHQTDASDEIKEYFGKLIAREEEYPSVSKIKENIAEIKGILSQALKGENVTYKKLKRSDVKKLQKAIHTFISRPGKSLRDEVIAYGGIKKDSEIAKALGYDSKKKDRMFTNRPNAFEKEDVLIEWLAEKGYITPTQEGETYADTEKRWDEVMNLFYNAENVYTPEERLKQEQRETALANKQEAEGVVRELLADDKLGLKDVDDLYDLLNNVLISNSETDIIKINNEAIKYIRGQLTIAERDLNKAIKEIKKSQKDITKEAQSILEKYISQLPLNYQNKKALMSEIKNVSDFDTLYKKITDLKPKVDGMVKKEIMNKHRTNIDNMIRTMKPKKGKNDIEHNRFFKILQGISRQTKENAKEAYEQWESNYWDKLFEGDSEGLERETREFMEKIRKDSPENTLDIGFAELVMNQYLSYKANGAKSSYDLLAELDKNLQGIRASAKAGEALIKDKKREKREKEVASVVEYVDSHEPVKSLVARVFQKGQKSNNFYLKNTDWYSITSGLFGKEWADKHDLLAPNVNYLNKTTLRVHEAQKEGKRIYKLKSIGDLIDKFEKDLRKEDFTLYRYEQKNDEIIEHSSPISKMQIMTIYNSLKNEKTANLYRKNYEKFDEDGNQITAQLDSLIGLLSKEDMEFADYMQKDLEQNYDELNKINIALYGIDLVKEDNYFPRTSKQFDSTYDPNAISANPYTAIVSQMKERTSFAVPIPKDIYDIYTKNVGDYNYMVEMFNKYKDVYDVINDTNVEEAIKRKYSSDVYDTLIEQMKSISIGGQRSVDSDLNKLGRRIMNNVIASKIALNINVFIKQLVSFTNFSVGMSKVKFYKNLAYAIAHPVETVKFMNEYNYETIKGRVIGGSQTEAIARLTKDLESFKGGISAKARYDWVKFMSSFVAMGDIAPIYFAGYARFKDYLDQGIDLKTAQEKFMVDVNRTQQSSAQVGLSLAQQDKSAFARMFGAFLNAPAQYMRQINNALIQHGRKEISDEEFMDVITNYVVVQPILFTLVSNALASLWSDGDDEEEPLLFGVMTQMALSGFGGYPYLSAFLTGVSKKLEGEVWDVDVGTIPLVNVLFIDDVNRASRKLDKKKLNTLDVVDVIQPMVEPIIPVPITAGKQYYRGINKLVKEK